MARVSTVAANPNHAIPAVKAAVRSYRANESAARDLISTVWNISDRNLEGTASVINGLVDILDDEEKKRDLLQAWNGFKIEVCLYTILGSMFSYLTLSTWFIATQPVP